MTYVPSIPKQVTMLIDSREKLPLLFPGVLHYHADYSSNTHGLVHVKTTTRKLKTGDYYLQGHRSACILERKASPEEIHANLVRSGRRKFLLALDRLQAATNHPYLLLDASPAQMLKHSPWVEDPTWALNQLYRECTLRNIPILWVGNAQARSTRMAMGSVLLQIMLTHILHPTSRPPAWMADMNTVKKETTT